MRGRMNGLRDGLADALRARANDDRFDFIARHRGMFSLLGATPEQVDALRARDIEIVIKDLSFAGQLPCVGAYFADPHVPADVQFHHFFKVGAAFDREEALLRVFTEYTQGRRAHEFGADVEIDTIDFRRLPTRDDDADNLLSAFMFGMVPYRDADFLRAAWWYQPGDSDLV